MDILIYGAGVLGSVYAALLHEAGHQVAILARGRRLEDIREHGIILEDGQTGQRTVSRVPAVERLEPQDEYDLVVVVMRKNQVAEVLPALAANQWVPTVLFLMNNAAGPDEFTRALGPQRVLLGFPGAGGERQRPVVRYVTTAGPQAFTVTIGEPDGRRTPRLARIEQAFERAGIPVDVSPNIDAWLKYHVALVSPIANALYRVGGDNYRLAHAQDSLVLMVRAVREAFAVLRDLGYPMTPPWLGLLRWLPEPLLVSQLPRFFNSRKAELALAAHANAARDEMQHLAGEFMALARSSSVPTPALDQLYPYADPETPAVPGLNAEIPLDWSGVWAWLAALAGLVLLLRALGRKRRD
ncbi:MAG: ketopantoate reductase family protein [Chloroflexia bacterium]|nr:ketopantoate reductase family protein [Chloroflexia bacterium]